MCHDDLVTVFGSQVKKLAQHYIEKFEIDIDLDLIISRRAGCVLKKMRLPQARQADSGKRGWLVSLDDLNR